MEHQTLPQDQFKLYRSITRRYLLAVMIIAFLSGVAFYTLKTALNDFDSTAYIVNLSGRQRMLSQHIALDAHRLHEQKFIASKPYENTTSLMSRNISDMRKANKQLSSGFLENRKVVDLSPTLRELYFGDKDVYNRVNDYLDKATLVLESPSAERVKTAIAWIDDNSEQLLKDLNTIVNQYQAEGEERLAFIERLEIGVISTTLLALLLEILFIFRPMAREVIASRTAEAKTLNNLQDLVELRTLKLENTNKKLKKIASLDPLTGLRNRLTLEIDIEKLISAFQEHKQPFTVAMVDIDFFKSVNDEYGHPAGDYVLKTLAHLFSEQTREYDHVYRAGGEEFFIILQRVSFEEANNKLEHLRQLVSEYEFHYEGQPISLTISLGVFHTELFPIRDPHELFQVVDEALYHSKHSGRNRLTIATHERSEDINTENHNKLIVEFSTSDLHQIKHIEGDFFLLTGYSDDLLKQKQMNFHELVYEDDRALLDKAIADAKKGIKRFITIRLKSSDGLVKIVGVHTESTDHGFKLDLQDALLQSNSYNEKMMVHNFHAMLENTNDYIYFKNRFHVFTAASKSLVELTSVNNRKQLVGQTDYEVFPKEYADEYFKLERKVFSGDCDVAQDFQPTMTTEGVKGWVDNRKYPIRDHNNNIIGLFGIARVISDDDYKKMKHTRQTS